MSKFVSRISSKAVMNTMKTISRGGLWNTKKDLKAEGIDLDKKTYSRDEVRKIFKTAGTLKGQSTTQAGWQTNQMANRAFAAQDQIQKNAIKEQRGVSQRMLDLRNRVFRKKIDGSQALQGSQAKVSQKKIDDAKKSPGKKSAPAPTLHAVPTGGNVGLRSTSAPDDLPPPTLADGRTEPLSQVPDHFASAADSPAPPEPAISDEEFAKLKDQARDITGTNLLS